MSKIYIIGVYFFYFFMNNKKLIAFDMYDTLVHMTKYPNPYKKFFSQLWLQDSVLRELSFMLQTTDKNIEDILPKNIQSQKNISFLIDELASNIYNQLSSLFLYDDFLSTIEILKQKWYKTAVVSNLSKPYNYPLIHLVPRNTFDYTVLSYVVGIQKPDRKIFDYLQVVSWHTSDEIVMIGDSLKSDVQWAKNSGIEPIHIQRNQSLIKKDVHYVQISRLSELLDIFSRVK